MYLITKKKDYYDGVVGSVGMDKTIVYERSPVVITDAEKMPKQFRYRKYHWSDENFFRNVCHAQLDHKKSKKYCDVRGFIVGFCGKLYMGWKFNYKVMERGLMGIMVEVTKTDIIYGYENAKQYLKADYWNNNLNDDIKFVETYDPIEIFRTYKTPIFVFDRELKDEVFIINPILKEFQFYKVVDAFTAFTELQMFVSGVLGVGEKELIEVEDKYKIGQHGYDKWSFRRKPTKKK